MTKTKTTTMVLRAFTAFIFATAVSSNAQVYDVAKDYSGDILSALNAARQAPGVVYLTRGTYTIPSGTVIDSPGITIRGDGPGATSLLLSGDGDGIIFSISAPNVDYCGGLESLRIDSVPGRSSGRNILITRCRDGHINNVWIDGPGHGLVFYCPDDSTKCGRWKINELSVRNIGPHAAIIIDGGNDQFFDQIHIRGVQSQGSRGVLIKGSKGALVFQTLEVILQEVGIAIVPDSGRSVEFIHFDKAYGDTNLVYGWNFAGQGEIKGVTCDKCWGSANGKSTATTTGAGLNSRGVRIVNGDMIAFTDVQVFNNDGLGMEISGTSKNIQLNGGWISANGILVPGTQPGLYINNGSGGVQLTGTRIGNAVHSPVIQSCGVEIESGVSNVTMTGLDLRGNIQEVCQ